MFGRARTSAGHGDSGPIAVAAYDDGDDEADDSRKRKRGPPKKTCGVTNERWGCVSSFMCVVALFSIVGMMGYVVYRLEPTLTRTDEMTADAQAKMPQIKDMIDYSHALTKGFNETYVMWSPYGTSMLTKSNQMLAMLPDNVLQKTADDLWALTAELINSNITSTFRERAIPILKSVSDVMAALNKMADSINKKRYFTVGMPGASADDGE